jgi:hypothetical protein
VRGLGSPGQKSQSGAGTGVENLIKKLKRKDFEKSGDISKKVTVIYRRPQNEFKFKN